MDSIETLYNMDTAEYAEIMNTLSDMDQTDVENV